MRIILACTSYWHNEAEAVERYVGLSTQKTDARTGAHLYYLNPDYDGVMGLRAWYTRSLRVFNPIATYVACGTWSEPRFCPLCPLVTVLNAGVSPRGDYGNRWQYMGCALTALMAAVCNRNDWDALILLEPDALYGKIDWPRLLGEFLKRRELVMGPAWYRRNCDIVAWKPEAAVRYLHCRNRPNLNAPDTAPWLDDELHQMFFEQYWNPWPHIETTRQDFAHPTSPVIPNDVVMGWPFVRLPDPAIVPRYLAECTALATPLGEA